MKKHLFLALLLGCGTFLFAQNPNKISIKGIVQDTTGEAIALPTVMLLNPKDSSLVNFTRGDATGGFEFKNVKNSAYLLKITYVSFLPLQIPLAPCPTPTHDLGKITIKPITSELLEVVIKAAKSTLSIRGDTIEYDASSFKVPPGSTVEDLLRRLPGIEVDADGNIKAQGRDIKRVYVDGKTFFGDDPKAATKNLGAETLSKIQVYNEKSEQAKLTGVDDGRKEKAMNLELKEEYKKGQFGKVTAAGGDQNRWALRGNFNRFNSKAQLSFIGFANNINQTGVNWDDYGEFKGQNSFNGNQDNGDFGFASGGGWRFYGPDDSAPTNNFDGRGFTKNHGVGSNYNFDNKKTKANASYFYNQTRLALDEFGLRQTFLADSTFSNTDTTGTIDFRQNHALTTRLEHEIDSNDVVILKANLRFSHNAVQNRTTQLFTSQNDAPTRSLALDNSTDLGTWRLTSTAIFRHRFKKKGRSFAVSAGYNDSKSGGSDKISSLNRFFEATTFTEQVVSQLNENANRTRQLKSSLLFTNPLAKTWFSETFYNFSSTKNLVDRQVSSPFSQNRQRVDSLSVFYDFTTLYNRIGQSIRYSKAALNASVGVAVQNLQLDGAYSTADGEPNLVPPTAKKYTNLTPNMDVNYEFPNNKWLSASYSYGITEPKLSDLQPIPNVNNPAFRTLGNPDLTPERSHVIGLNFNSWNPANFSNVGVNEELTFYDNQIVQSQRIETLDSIGIRTTTRPINVANGWASDSWFWTNFPIVKTKLTMFLNGGVNVSGTPSFVNDVKNETQSAGFSVRGGFNFTPNSKLIADLGGKFGLTKIKYSIQSSQNQDIIRNGLNGSVKWQFASKFFLETTLESTFYRIDRFGFDQQISIWNCSVRRLLGKTNRLEMRLAAFDLLNQRVAISQSGSQNFLTRSEAPTLARYFMLSLSYNVKGYENKLKKNDWW